MRITLGPDIIPGGRRFLDPLLILKLVSGAAASKNTRKSYTYRQPSLAKFLDPVLIVALDSRYKKRPSAKS